MLGPTGQNQNAADLQKSEKAWAAGAGSGEAAGSTGWGGGVKPWAEATALGRGLAGLQGVRLTDRWEEVWPDEARSILSREVLLSFGLLRLHLYEAKYSSDCVYI